MAFAVEAAPHALTPKCRSEGGAPSVGRRGGGETTTTCEDDNEEDAGRTAGPGLDPEHIGDPQLFSREHHDPARRSKYGSLTG
ncbi:hypothetical protein ACHAW6_015701 [Cyclotella cf. meneghiniana]